MQKTLEIKQRLATITNISKIAQALQIITVARIKNIQNRLKQAKKFHKAIKGLLDQVGIPVLNQKPSSPTQIIIIGSNRGFCGAFNENLFAPLEFSIKKEEKNGGKVEVFSVGKKVCAYLKSTKQIFSCGYDELLEKAGFSQARAFIAPLYRAFYRGESRRIIVIYNSYQSMLSQHPTTLTLLPISEKKNTGKENFIAEPSLLELQEEIFYLYAVSAFYLYLLESISGELGCRLITMKNASDNSKEMIKQLTLAAHKIRQTGITQELSEIMTTFEALKEEE